MLAYKGDPSIRSTREADVNPGQREVFWSGHGLLWAADKTAPGAA